MSARLELALQSGLSLTQPLSLICPAPDQDLSHLPLETQVVQPFKPFHDHFARLGYRTVPESSDPCTTAVVFLPRSKSQARALIHQASERADGLIVVDGPKTNGIDSILKDIRKRVAIGGPLAKARGKIFWFHPEPEAFQGWAAPRVQRVDGYITAPGVFSADGIDPASALLKQVLPARLGSAVADLGAGWGYLSSTVLEQPTLKTVHLVEADHMALTCARANIADDRARFHWADATAWTAPDPLDTVMMNPPFHTTRKADPGLGQAFIAAAARNLNRNGSLWMVANRHLPYEATLHQSFAKVDEVVGDNRFKVFHASRPRR